MLRNSNITEQGLSTVNSSGNFHMQIEIKICIRSKFLMKATPYNFGFHLEHKLCVDADAATQQINISLRVNIFEVFNVRKC